MKSATARQVRSKAKRRKPEPLMSQSTCGGEWLGSSKWPMTSRSVSYTHLTLPTN